MTRLQSADINHIAANLEHYDRELFDRTGHSLSGIACRAAGIDDGRTKNILPELRVSVVPISSGEGIIRGFCEAVLSILLHMGCNASITLSADVAGITESFKKRADILMMADDERFVALHIQSHTIADNAVCTGQVYVTGLNLMAGGLKGRAVLVIGCGRVGSSAAESLIRAGARVSVYDIDSKSSNALAAAIRNRFDARIQVIDRLDAALLRYKFIFDASPASNIIYAQHITPDTYVSAPGLPCGLNDEAKTAISKRILHDPLQLGVATMLVSVAKYHCGLQAEG
ncbi:MAG: 3-methylornithyl-N6-L-lysine dehydrogenase PylD [Desulfobacterales bacterium]